MKVSEEHYKLTLNLLTKEIAKLTLENKSLIAELTLRDMAEQAKEKEETL